MTRRSGFHSRWSIMISGTGSNLQTILDEGEGTLPRLVISSRADAPGLGKARRMGIPVMVLPTKIDWQALEKTLRDYGIQKIFLLGFMKIVPAWFLDSQKFEVLNLHPSLLPNYPGLKAFEKAFAEHATLGATIHKVVPEVDAGPILRQKKVARLSSFSECRLVLSFVEQALVREVWAHESL